MLRAPIWIDVGPFGDQVERLVVERFGNDAQAEAVADLGHDAQRLKAQALKCVGRGAGLERAAAEELRAPPPLPARRWRRPVRGSRWSMGRRRRPGYGRRWRRRFRRSG
jgi:hypothetical protein